MKTAVDESPAHKPALSWNTILVPTDFSEPSKEAVKIAADLAALCGAKITLLHVVRLPASCPGEVSLDVDELLKSARECLEEIANQIPSSVFGEKLTELGERETVQEIIEAARSRSADLIVMATHGHNRLKRFLLGSTTEKVMRHAPCPVLVVRGKEIAPESHQERRN